ncbi:SC6A7 protein, partial [Polyodon spathula]|nr:SC6A7 protein [Polyodon spathula]
MTQGGKSSQPLNTTGTISPCEEYWSCYVLHIQGSSGIRNPGRVRWNLCLCLLLSQIIVYLCILKGVKSSGKVWIEAALQIFYSLGVDFSGLLTFASYNTFHQNIYRDTFIVMLGNAYTSILAGFAIFSVLGCMSQELGVPVTRLPIVFSTGPGLAFVVYPQAMTMLPLAPFWSFLFFFMLQTLGLDSQFAFALLVYNVCASQASGRSLDALVAAHRYLLLTQAEVVDTEKVAIRCTHYTGADIQSNH